MGVLGKRLALWGTIAAVLALLLLYAFRPRAELVDVETVVAGPLQVTVDAEGIARIKDVFTISAPVAGRLLRTPLAAGDPLTRDVSVVATIEPSDPAFLDPRALAESRQELETAEAARKAAAAEVERARTEQRFAHTELERARTLFESGSVPRRFADEAERTAGTAEAAVAGALAALDAREHEVLRARARLITPVDRSEGTLECECVTLTSPVNGRVLRVFEKSATVVAPGTALLEVGDPEELEVVADFLSADAVRIRPGQIATIEGWGGDGALEARVRHVEPFGFTKVSALGIEEQRVNVVFDLETSRERWEPLGHGYRVISRVVLWEGYDVLTVPVTALYRQASEWYVFVAAAGRAEQRAVTPGFRSGLKVQVLDGLDDGDVVIVNPPASLEPGARVRERGRV
jgi:HlyD family secretion protein